MENNINEVSPMLDQTPISSTKRAFSKIWIFIGLALLFILGLVAGCYLTLKEIEKNTYYKTEETKTETEQKQENLKTLELGKKLKNTLWYGDYMMGAANDSGISFYEDGTYVFITDANDILEFKFNAEKGTFKIKSETAIELTTNERIVVDKSGKENLVKASEVRELVITATGTEAVNAYESTDTMTVNDKYLGQGKKLFYNFSAAGLSAFSSVDLTKFSK